MDVTIYYIDPLRAKKPGLPGEILMPLLQSILSVMQMEEFGRCVYGVVIIAMLLVYGRGQRQSD